MSGICIHCGMTDCPPSEPGTKCCDQCDHVDINTLFDLYQETWRDLRLLTPVCVPTTGVVDKLQRTLGCVSIVERGRDYAISLHFSGRSASVVLTDGMVQDHVIRALSDLCIEVAK